LDDIDKYGAFYPWNCAFINPVTAISLRWEPLSKDIYVALQPVDYKKDNKTTKEDEVFILFSEYEVT
jgi:hypothetical protein